MAPELAESANAHLRDTLAAIDTLSARAVSVRAGFAALPRLAEGSGSVPDPVAHEAWLD